MMPVRFSLSLFVALVMVPAFALAGISAGHAQELTPDPGVAAPDQSAPPVRKSRRRRAAAAAAGLDQTMSAFAGRYAVMRDKRDTGCMLTLDKARVKGGERAQLAPGCRDQGIVIFDPSVWQVVKGELVLTARAGHKTHLLKDGEGTWKKDPKEGKPLGLKKL